MFNKNRFLKFDIFILILFPILATFISLLINANYLVVTLLFFGLPSLYLSIRTRKRIAKTALFSLIFSVPLTIIVGYLASIDKAWYIKSTIFDVRLFGLSPIEDFVWGFLLVYAVVIFYEHFLDKGKNELINKNMRYLIFVLMIILVLFFILVFTNPQILNIPYAYLWLGLFIVILPSIAFLSFFPKMLVKYFKTIPYFVMLTGLHELTALELDLWVFPGANFIHIFNFLGHLMPLEEFIFFIVLGSAAIISYFEFFEGDRK
ncbi:MAG: lycopene cyclase domain-containing protein [Candidatus Woesearchaeota archaeon]